MYFVFECLQKREYTVGLVSMKCSIIYPDYFLYIQSYGYIQFAGSERYIWYWDKPKGGKCINMQTKCIAMFKTTGLLSKLTRDILTKHTSPFIPTPFVNSDLWHVHAGHKIHYVINKTEFSASIFLTCHAITPTHISYIFAWGKYIDWFHVSLVCLFAYYQNILIIFCHYSSNFW